VTIIVLHAVLAVLIAAMVFVRRWDVNVHIACIVLILAIQAWYGYRYVLAYRRIEIPSFEVSELSGQDGKFDEFELRRVWLSGAGAMNMHTLRVYMPVLGIYALALAAIALIPSSRKEDA
jgi:hypothetical protein